MLKLALRYVQTVLALSAALGGLAGLIFTNVEEISAIWIVLAAIGCAVTWDQLREVSSPVAVLLTKLAILAVFPTAVFLWHRSGALHWTVQYVACSLEIGCQSAIRHRITHALKGFHFSGFQLASETTPEEIKVNDEKANENVHYCKRNFDENVYILSYSIENPQPGELIGNVSFKLQSIDKDWDLLHQIRSLTSDAKGGNPIDPNSPFEVNLIEFTGCAKRITYDICIQRVLSVDTSFAESAVELTDIRATARTTNTSEECQ